MTSLFQDVRYALRQLRNAPGFALTAVLTLAFGIGATTAIFSIVEGVLLRPLPFAEPSRLAIYGDELVGTDPLPPGSVSPPEIPILERETKGLSSLGAYQSTSYELAGAGAPAQISASRLQANIIPMLGVSPILGRGFTQQEEIGRAHV